mmetsp:Transcript_156277/g.291590  ORF Transcript_156277/g.291590 Transcript_156277/m.291590 type:complete len:100 (+) Transcript_156277:591-890(+)
MFVPRWMGPGLRLGRCFALGSCIVTPAPTPILVLEGTTSGTFNEWLACGKLADVGDHVDRLARLRRLLVNTCETGTGDACVADGDWERPLIGSDTDPPL